MPREKHIPQNAHRTSVCFTPEEKAAIRWISDARRARGNRRTTTNDIVVDALWLFLEKTEGKTREQMRGLVPAVTAPLHETAQSNVTQMPKPKKKR